LTEPLRNLLLSKKGETPLEYGHPQNFVVAHEVLSFEEMACYLAGGTNLFRFGLCRLVGDGMLFRRSGTRQ